ncbi:unnamed protein product [Withania somnifera]
MEHEDINRSARCGSLFACLIVVLYMFYSSLFFFLLNDGILFFLMKVFYYIFELCTFALYSLICRYAKVGLVPSQQPEDKDVSSFKLDSPDRRTRRASKLKSMLENNNFAKVFMLIATMLGTSMVIGDGVFTRCISVLSAVRGLKEAAPSFLTQGRLVWIALAILILLFMFQRFGTEKVGNTFAPVLCTWLIFIAGIDIYNFAKYDPTVIEKFLNSKYIIDSFKRNKKNAWISLGGVVMCIKCSQISMCCVTYPALILAYLGQAAFLRKHVDDVSDTFYKSIPHSLYWPLFAVAELAAIIASQALISGTFAIIQQSLALGCFPQVKIVHTSTKNHGLIYIPEINNLLMFACVIVTLAFRTTEKLNNAYGIAVVFVMTLASCFLVLVMIMIWKTHILLVIIYVLIIGTVELVYLSAVLYKFDQGGYLPLVFSMVLVFIMYVWNYVYRKKYHFELEHKISPLKVKETSLPISKVPVEERFLFRRVKPYDLYVFRCAVRYGYNDVQNEEQPFERLFAERMKEFIRDAYMVSVNAAKNNKLSTEQSNIEMENDCDIQEDATCSFCREQDVMARKGYNNAKRVVIDYAFNFLKRNLRQSSKVFDIPHKRMLKVGMIYEL